MKTNKMLDEIVMTDVKFMTAREKHMVLRQWNLFVKNGCQFGHFTKRLYNHLIMHCSFIAHYNRNGFWHTYFSTQEDRRRFFNQFQTGISHEYGSTHWLFDQDYLDINNEMCEIIHDIPMEMWDFEPESYDYDDRRRKVVYL